MKVKELLKFFKISSDDETIVTSISDNSKKGNGNWIYFNLSSFEHHVSYINEAISRNAYLILSKYNHPKAIYIPDLDQKINSFLIYYYNFKKNFKLIGITGTNGKSSLSNFIKQSLILANYKVKNVTTIKEKNAYYSNLTTPNNFRFFEILRKANKEKLDYLIVEISSIGYVLNRIKDIDFDYLFLTNIDKDHLDFHKSVKEYQKVKVRILDTSSAIKFVDYHVLEKFNFKTKVFPVNYQINKTGHLNTLKVAKSKVSTPLLFKTNLINLSFCYYLLRKIGIKKRETLDILSKVRSFKGRLDIVSKDPLIIIDYAHSESSFENILKECKEIFDKKIILIFGAGGNRDQSKRKDYALFAKKYADYVILTNDNPRNESPIEIVNQMKIYLTNFEIIYDRKKAIERGINLLDSNHLLLILGKGNEDYILMDGYKIFHNDYYEVEKCLMKNILH